MSSLPTHCAFQNRSVATLGRPIFRLTHSDGIAAMVVTHHSGDMIVPLQSFARVFGIQPESADAHMLQLIERALQFVCLIELGGELPREVLTGEASWTPSTYHIQLASARLQVQLIGWISGLGNVEGGQLTPEMLIASVNDPAIQPRVQEALRKAAAELGIKGGGPAVSALIEELAGELAYIEELRARLLEPVKAVAKRVLRTIKEQFASVPSRRETSAQVGRMASKAVEQLVGWFEQVDAQTSEILPALRDLEQQRNLLRPHRDQLYCVLRAWEPLLHAWEALPANSDREPDKFWKVVEDTYRFLAPRYMSVQKWQTVVAAPVKTDHGKTVLVW